MTDRIVVHRIAGDVEAIYDTAARALREPQRCAHGVPTRRGLVCWTCNAARAFTRRGAPPIRGSNE